jgi:hypothetical protein
MIVGRLIAVGARRIGDRDRRVLGLPAIEVPPVADCN